MLTFNQVWWSTYKICDRYFQEAAEQRDPRPGAADIYDLLWESGFLEVAPEKVPADRRTMQPPVRGGAYVLPGRRGATR